MVIEAGNDLDSFLNDFWLYFDENSKSMGEENSAIEELLYSLAGDCDEFLYEYEKTRIRNLCCISSKSSGGFIRTPLCGEA